MLYTVYKSFIITLTVFCSCSTLLVNANEAAQCPPFLSVKGFATVSKPADELMLNIGVVTQDKTAENALRENSSKMTGVIKALQQTGLREGEYKTGRFNIRPIYSQRPKNALPDWSPSIESYEVTNALAIKTEKIDLAGELIDAATKSGANSADSIRFGLRDPYKYRSEVIEAAAKTAMQEAKILSDAAGISLLRIKYLSLDDSQLVAPMARGQLYTKSMGMESAPIEAGEIEIHASVTLHYEIE